MEGNPLRWVYPWICHEISKKHKPRVWYVAYTTTDDLAHAGRYDEYLSMAHRIDGYIKELWDFVQREDAYRNKATFIITTDLGRVVLPWKTGNTMEINQKPKAEGSRDLTRSG